MSSASQRTRPLGLFPGLATPRLYDHLVGVLRVCKIRMEKRRTFRISIVFCSEGKN